MEDYYSEKQINFKSFPFSGSKYFTNKEIESIYKNLISSEPKGSEIQNYNILTENENGFYVYISKENEDDYECLFILRYPKIFNIYNDKESIEGLTIYTDFQCRNILYELELAKYIIKINGKEIKNDSEIDIIYPANIVIEAKYIENNLNEFENFKDFILREKSNLLQENIFVVKKKKLSLYFNDITLTNNPKKENFELLIDKNRLIFIENINNFIKSKNMFYFILGTDGIGKTITLLYYSSLLHDSYNILYLNLKLFSKRSIPKIQEIFLNELKRIFMVDITFGKSLQFLYKTYLELIKTIKNKAKDYLKGQGLKYKMDYFWFLLFEFIKNFENIGLFKPNLLIILDQYKSKDIDENNVKLDYLLSMINSLMNKIYSKVKLLIVISINNYDTKNLFIENFDTIAFSSNLLLRRGEFLLQNSISKKKEIKDINFTEIEEYELKNIEQYLNSKLNEINKKFNENVIKINFDLNYINSSFLINNEYSHITQKEYLNIFTNCSKLIEKDFPGNLTQCIKAFNGSFKYYQLLLNIKDKIEEENSYKNKNKDNLIIQTFYKEMYNKIKNNIINSFNSLNFKEKTIDFNVINVALKCLIKLRNQIYEKESFTPFDLKYLIQVIPIKYINISLDYSGIINEVNEDSKFNISNSNSDKILNEDYKFNINYSNIFVKHAINKIITDISKKDISINFGEEFEKRVNDKLSHLIFHGAQIYKRNVFSLVGLTKSTKNYLDKLRQKEDLEFYEFYDLKRLQKISIDGIDDKVIKSSIFDIKNKDIFLNQISKTGRSFDSGLLIRKDEINNQFTHDLVLTQETISKILNLE